MNMRSGTDVMSHHVQSPPCFSATSRSTVEDVRRCVPTWIIQLVDWGLHLSRKIWIDWSGPQYSLKSMTNYAVLAIWCNKDGYSSWWIKPYHWLFWIYKNALNIDIIFIYLPCENVFFSSVSSWNPCKSWCLVTKPIASTRESASRRRCFKSGSEWWLRREKVQIYKISIWNCRKHEINFKFCHVPWLNHQTWLWFKEER